MRSLRKTTKSFIEEANIKHNNFYDYSKVDYKGCNNKVQIICPKHGIFLQKPGQHLFKRGCPTCGIIKVGINSKSNTQEFISKAHKIHNSFYNYDNSNYIGAKEFITITCPVHGDFQQRPNYHLSGNGCTQCYKENNGFGRSNFLSSCKNNKGLLYIIECYNENETFYKIGITSKSVKERFKRFDKFPYKYKIIKEIVDIPENIFNLEKILHKKFKNFRYKPNLYFRGNTECFLLTNKIIKNDI